MHIYILYICKYVYAHIHYTYMYVFTYAVIWIDVPGPCILPGRRLDAPHQPANPQRKSKSRRQWNTGSSLNIVLL